MEDEAKQSFLFVFFFKEKKSVYSSFQREIPCFKPLTVFFSSITASINQSSVNKHARCSSNRFFFTKKKSIYRSFQREIPYCRLDQSFTPLVLITHSTLFSFPLLLLRVKEVDFIGCYETVDQQTAEPPEPL